MILLPHLDLEDAIIMSPEISVAVTYYESVSTPSKQVQNPMDKIKRDGLDYYPTYILELYPSRRESSSYLTGYFPSCAIFFKCSGTLLVIALLMFFSFPAIFEFEPLIRGEKMDTTFYLIQCLIIISFGIIPIILIDLQ